MRKEKYNLVLTASSPCSIRVGSIQIDFDGEKKFGVKDIPLSELTKLRDICNKKGIRFVYVDSFYGCFKTFTYTETRKASDILNAKRAKAKQRELEEPKVEETKIEEPKVEETKVEETPVEEVLDEQPSESK